MALTKREKWQEIANRGLQDNFDPETRLKFDEAINRGLITMPSAAANEVPAPTEAPQQEIELPPEPSWLESAVDTVGSGISKIGPMADQAREGMFDTIGNVADFASDVITDEDVRGRAGDIARAGFRNVLGGASFGLYDEMKAYEESIGHSLLTKSRYDTTKRELKAEQDQYAKEYPTAQTVGYMSGGMVNPINLYGGKGLLKDAAIDAVIGGVTGAGEAEEGERLAGAARGSEMAAGFGTAMRVGGKALETTLGYARDIGGQMIDKAGEFIPIHLAADDSSYLRAFYQKIISNVPGGGDDLLTQQRRATGATEVELIAGKEKRDLAFKKEKQEIVKQKTMSKQALAETEDTQRRALKEQIEQVKTGGNRQLQKTMAQADAQYRNSVVNQSMPSNMQPDNAANISQKMQQDPQSAMADLHNEWNLNGFSEVKTRPFDIDADSLWKDITKVIEPHERSALGTIEDMFDSKLRAKVRVQIRDGQPVPDQQPRISGEDLMNARNDYRFLVNTMGDDSKTALEKAAYAKAADKIDNVIRKQLDPVQAKAYDKELKQWGNFLTTRDSVGRAGVKKQGFFDPEDILTTERQHRGARFSEGKTPLAKASQEHQLQRGVFSNQAQEGLDQAVARLTREADAVGQPKSATNQQRNQIDEAAQTQLDGLELRKMKPDEALTAINDQLNDFKRKGASESKSPYQAAFAIAALSALSFFGDLGPVGVTASVATALTLGKVFANPNTQRYLAGQTGWQKTINASLKGMNPQVKAAFLRGLPRVMRQQLIHDEEQSDG